MADSPQGDRAPGETRGVTELLPKNGLVYSEKANLSEVPISYDGHAYCTRSGWVDLILSN